MHRLGIASVLLFSTIAAFAGLAPAVEPTLLHVNTFPTARSLPFYAGVEHGFFARHGLNVQLEFTESSERQRAGLASGAIDIVHAAVDNAVAMIDVAKVDIIIVSGGDSGTNDFYVQNTIKDFADIRGHAIAVDATNTAYALQAKKILAQHGLKADVDYTLNPVGNGTHRLQALLTDTHNAGAILNVPFSLEAAAHGMKSLGHTTDLLGPYQAGGAFVQRAWARDHASVLENYLAGFIEALRWSLDPKNRTAAVAILVDKLKLSPDLAERSLTLIAEPGFGFTPDAKFDMTGFKNVLTLRAETEGGTPAPMDHYVDLSYYDRAMKLVQ
ncbi:MAG TPA: ABC transporter substrate-binding protein [Xanthobacteraceae bacterium]|jgi:ABC-type nitrate/sulfonate/bicarbonate transport system substrate-binding protein|nr:ABC transporter substrate-binding protein [Xanthobacteraceae bacterium]